MKCHYNHKESYKSASEANDAIKKMAPSFKDKGRKKKKRPIRSYKCEHCKMWHITSKETSKKKYTRKNRRRGKIR